MKLLFCRECFDVVKLSTKVRRCACKLCSGRYLEDELNAEYWGPAGTALLLGFNNPGLWKAITNHREKPTEKLGHRFEAFVIPDSAPTTTWSEDEPI